MKRRKISQVLAMVMALFLLGLSGCKGEPKGGAGSGAEAGGEGKLKIGLTMSSRDQWLSTMERAAMGYAKEQGITLTSFDSNTDVVTQLSHVSACANDGYDAMIVNLVNTDNAQEVIDAAGDMPVVFVNRTPGNPDQLLQDDKIVYVGSDEKEAGKLEGEYIAKLLQDAGKTDVNIVVMTGTLGMQAATLRTSAAKEALETSGLKVNYVFEDTADWERAKAMEKFVQFMGTGKPYDAVICNNDEMALGVVEAMKTTNEGKVTVPVAGVDATASALKSIEDGDLAFSAFQNAIGQGESAVVAAVKLAKGEGCARYNWVPFEPVDAANVANYK